MNIIYIEQGSNDKKERERDYVPRLGCRCSDNDEHDDDEEAQDEVDEMEDKLNGRRRKVGGEVATEDRNSPYNELPQQSIELMVEPVLDKGVT